MCYLTMMDKTNIDIIEELTCKSLITIASSLLNSWIRFCFWVSENFDWSGKFGGNNEDKPLIWVYFPHLLRQGGRSYLVLYILLDPRRLRFELSIELIIWSIILNREMCCTLLCLPRILEITLTISHTKEKKWLIKVSVAILPQPRDIRYIPTPTQIQVWD